MATAVAPPVTLQRRRFTVAEYARMLTAGILLEDDRVELIDGEVRVMSPIGPLHATIVDRLNRIIVLLCAHSAIMRVQSAIQLKTIPSHNLILLCCNHVMIFMPKRIRLLPMCSS